jgi:hypothetical protein
MTYSGIAAAFQRKITAPGENEAAHPIGFFDDLVAAVLDDADQRGRPIDMSLVNYSRALDVLDSLDEITVPVDGLGKIATIDEHDDEPQAQGFQSVAGVSGSSSPVHTSLPPSIPPSTPTNTLPTPSPSTPRKQPTTPTTVTAWKHLDEHLKFAEACRVAEDLEGMTFSLDLSERVERTLWTHKDPCRLVSGYINRALRAQGITGTPFAFAVEYAPLQENYRGELRSKLHLHGVVVSDEPAKVKAALMAAGGKLAGKSRSRQVKLAQVDVKRGGGAGWARYALKDEDRTWRHIDGERVIFLNDSLRRLARDRWQERHVVQRRQPKTAVVTPTVPPTALNEVPAARAPGASQRPSMAMSGMPALMAEVARVYGRPVRMNC